MKKHLLTVLNLLLSSATILSSCGNNNNNSGEKTHTHNFIYVQQHDSSCLRPGYKEHFECIECNSLFDLNKKEIDVEEITIAATGHTIIDKSIEATCTETGYVIKECSVCGHTIEFSEAPIKGHSYVVSNCDFWISYNGHRASANLVCTSCNKTINVDAISVDYVETIPSTCSSYSKGKLVAVFPEIYNIPNQEKEYTNPDIPCPEHNYVKVDDIPATCEGYGEIDRYQCSDCGQYKSTTVNPSGHRYMNYYSFNSEENSYTAQRKCLNENIVLEEETVTGVYVMDVPVSCTQPELGHYEYNFVNPNFVDQKSTPKSVSVGQPLEHHLVHSDYLAPTCTESGHNAYDYCDRDGCSYSTKEVISPLGHRDIFHDIEEIVEPNSNKKSGYVLKTFCHDCNELLETKKIQFNINANLVSKYNFNLYTNDSGQISIDKSLLEDENFSMKIEDGDLLSIDNDYKIHTKNISGSCCIELKSKNYNVFIKVNVFNDKLDLNYKKSSYYVTESEELNIDSLDRSYIKFETSNPEIMTVNEEGKINFLSEGKATLSAVFPSEEIVEIPFECYKNWIKITGSKDLEIHYNKPTQIKYETSLDNLKIQYEIADKSIAAMDGNAAYALNSGTTTITLKNSLCDDVSVTVTTVFSVYDLSASNYKDYLHVDFSVVSYYGGYSLKLKFKMRDWYVPHTYGSECKFYVRFRKSASMEINVNWNYALTKDSVTLEYNFSYISKDYNFVSDYYVSYVYGTVEDSTTYHSVNSW